MFQAIAERLEMAALAQAHEPFNQERAPAKSFQLSDRKHQN